MLRKIPVMDSRLWGGVGKGTPEELRHIPREHLSFIHDIYPSKNSLKSSLAIQN
ncbi:hypothetical protein [Nostoc sp.]|uniref:hypothetical protein n=1 Tax=Nostoc sp. TaxID=1180 RepID=UPI002FFA3B0D